MAVSVTEPTLEEIVVAGYRDPLFFGKVFFKKTFKQASPPCHEQVVDLMFSRKNRKKIAKMFRGGAKTSLARVMVAHRIAYSYGTVTMVVGKSQDHAIKTIMWVRARIEEDGLFAKTFKLEKAIDPATGRPEKWTEEHITIYNRVTDTKFHVLAYGITGSVRGVNIDDDRPDFIIGDDIIDDENAATMEQREKVKTRLYGALFRSLTPTSENPDASMLLLQTPIHEEDAVEEACAAGDWETISLSCFDEEGNSVWEERLPTEELRAEKESYIRKNQLSVWNREMEVKITSSEMKLMLPEWLGFYEEDPEGGFLILSVDPTPPPKEKQTKDIEKLDDAVVMMTRFCKGGFHVLEYYTTKSPRVMELCNKIFEFYKRYRPTFVSIETHLFQRTIKEVLEMQMAVQGVYFQITPVEDRRNKFVRIKDTVSDMAYMGKIKVRSNMLELISQFNDYPRVKHDDLLDALSIAIMAINPALLKLEDTLIADYKVISLEDDYDEDDFDNYTGIEAAP